MVLKPAVKYQRIAETQGRAAGQPLTPVNALDGKSVLVTGAARGIGAAIAEAVVEAGGGVALLDIDPAGADTAAALSDRGVAHFFACDVRSLARGRARRVALPNRRSAASTASSTTPASTRTSTRSR